MAQQKQRAALLTKHHKLALIAPALAPLGFEVQLTEAFDTDQLGTFSGEVARTQSPVDCVKTKAKLASELTALPYGLGSEGSFGGGPLPGLMNWDEELLCLYNHSSSQFIIARASGPVPLSEIETDQLELIKQHIAKHDAAQGWILCSPFGLSKQWVKGLTGFEQVCQALTEAKLLSSESTLAVPIRLSPDLRAHYCPSRRCYIEQAAAELAKRLQALCPVCAAADFWPDAFETGLPCSACTYPTQRVNYLIKHCKCCGHTEREAAADSFADPADCPLCNP